MLYSSFLCVCVYVLSFCSGVFCTEKKNKQQQQNFYFIVLRCLVFMFSSFSFFLPLVFMADICVDLRNDLCCNFSFTISSLPKNKNIVFLSYVEYRFFFYVQKTRGQLVHVFFWFHDFNLTQTFLYILFLSVLVSCYFIVYVCCLVFFLMFDMREECLTQNEKKQ